MISKKQLVQTCNNIDSICEGNPAGTDASWGFFVGVYLALRHPDYAQKLTDGYSEYITPQEYGDKAVDEFVKEHPL